MPLPSAPFDAANSIYCGLSVLLLKPSAQVLTSVAAESDDDVITKTGHGLVTGQGVVYVSGTGFTGLTAGTLYYAIKLTADTFKVASTYANATAASPTAVDITADGTAGTFQKCIIFESEQLDFEPEYQETSIKRPDSTGKLRKVRTVTTEEQETFKFKITDVKRALQIFGGKLSGRIDGTITMWCPDPNDATGYVAMKSENDFAATITNDGGAKFGGGEFTSLNIKLESNKQGAIDWTTDAAV